MFIKQVAQMAMPRDDSHSRPDRRVGKTRKALREALTDLILERGYESVTVQDLIDRADVGRSTFYAHFIDKDDLLMSIFAELQVPGPDTSRWTPDDPAFSWTLDLFRHFGSGKRLFRAVSSSRSGELARRETKRWLEELARAELNRLRLPQSVEPMTLETVVSFLVGTFLGFMDWWMRPEHEQLTAEQVDQAFRALVLPGVSRVLRLEIELPARVNVAAG
jgi:AcrR family transcriptional regulator